MFRIGFEILCQKRPDRHRGQEANAQHAFPYCWDEMDSIVSKIVSRELKAGVTMLMRSGGVTLTID